jgi:hypothetical protein
VPSSAGVSRNDSRPGTYGKFNSRSALCCSTALKSGERGANSFGPVRRYAMSSPATYSMGFSGAAEAATGSASVAGHTYL